MRFETKPHPFSCGMAWPARTMSLCIVPPAGERWVHRPMPAGPAPCRQASTPAREDVGVCVEGLCPWDWLAALGARRHAVGPRAGVVYARPPGGQSPKRSAGRAAERRTAARWEAPPGTDTRTEKSCRWGRSAPVRSSVGVGARSFATRPRSQGARRRLARHRHPASVLSPSRRRPIPLLWGTSLRLLPAARATERWRSPAAGSGSDVGADAGGSQVQCFDND